MNEKFYEKHAWMLFLLIGIAILAGAIPHSLGFNTDPVLVETISGITIDDLKVSNPMFFNLYNFYFIGGGLSDFGLAFFIIIISATAYRQRQRWAWYAFWFIPVYFSAWIVLSYTLPRESTSSLVTPLVVFIILGLMGLFLPFKIFFQK
jgi:hypothetical protein